MMWKKTNIEKLHQEKQQTYKVFKEWFKLDDNPYIYKQLGNAVNVEIIRKLAEKLFSLSVKE